jgi:micrococcal nuclease
MNNPLLESFKQYDLKTPNWSLEGKEMWARVVDVYDADTITLILPLDFGYYKFSCRIYGIDTAELRSKIEENKLTAHRAKNRMLELCGLKNIQLDKIYSRKETQAMLNSDVYVVYVKCREWDKYGRLLVDVFNNVYNDVYNDHVNLADILVREKLAYPYFGGTKQTEDQQVIILE